MGSKLAIEFGEIHTHTIQKNWLDLFALIEQNRRRKLHRSVHGEKGVGDHFEARSGFADRFFRTAGRHPRELHLRES